MIVQLDPSSSLSRTRFSHAQSCQALKCGSRFHCVIPNLRHQSRRTSSRDWVAREIAVHEDFDFVSVFLSSESCCICWVSRPNTVLHASVEHRQSISVHSSGPKCVAASAESHLSWATKESLVHAGLYLVAPSFFRIGLFLPSNNSLSCHSSRGVHSLSSCSRCILIH